MLLPGEFSYKQKSLPPICRGHGDLDSGMIHLGFRWDLGVQKVDYQSYRMPLGSFTRRLRTGYHFVMESRLEAFL
jgi:hypothetical protein